ncbi:BTB/POZ domain-containing protein, partial [archaeon]
MGVAETNILYYTGRKGFEYKDWGTASLCSRADMLTYCSHDTVILKVSITVIGPSVVASNQVRQAIGKGSMMTKEMTSSMLMLAPKLFLSPTFSDLTFKIPLLPLSTPEQHPPLTTYDDLPAHKNIVCAASEVFTKMLTVDMRESKTHSITIPDYPVHIVKEMLRFIYKGYCRHSVVQAEGEGLLSLSKKYDIPSLVHYLEDHYAEHLDIHTLAQTWQLSQTYHCAALERCVLRYVGEHRELVGGQEDFMAVL